jgi:hypothetical protein
MGLFAINDFFVFKSNSCVKCEVFHIFILHCITLIVSLCFMLNVGFDIHIKAIHLCFSLFESNTGIECQRTGMGSHTNQSLFM